MVWNINYTLRIFCSVAAPTKTQSVQAHLRAWDNFKIMYISGEMSILMSLPPGSERREVTMEVLFSQIFAGINALKLQGQIKCKSKFSQWRIENCGLFFSIWWKQDSWIMDPLSPLVKPEEFLPQASRNFWSGLGKMAYLIFNVSHWLEFLAKKIII